ncbi:MAG: 30S ribosomal protein S6 [Myxococcales bacterium]|nr:30S ribosomal protein S6 [Myxococcales bacterium]
MTAAAATQERRAREYETIFIMRANADTKQAEKVLDRVRDVIGGRQAKLLEIDNWGRRKLAYEIEKALRGVFVYVRFAGYEDLVRELERNLGLMDEVLRFQTVLISPHVDLSAYEVEDDRLKFGELEPAEDDEEPGLAQRLGLVDRPKPDYSDEGSGAEGDEDDDSVEDDAGLQKPDSEEEAS